MRAQRLNDRERSMWVDNDQSLYLWWLSTGLAKRRFIRKHRAELDRLILAQLNKSPAS